MTIHDAGSASLGPADAALDEDGADADADLVLRTRSGDRAAFAELWRRHYRSGMTVARSVTSSLDPDDLVQEAYTRIYQSIVDGGGPTGSFRAYLFTCIRNTAAGWGRARRETTIDALETVEDPATTDQATAEALDRSLTHRAFRTLPTRWQEVLWYSEIEQMKPAEIAPLLGMKPTAVAQLTFRAREGLREAWIQAHLQSVADGSDCQWTIDHLGAYSRSNISRRDGLKVNTHLSECARCAIVASEAREVSRRLALVLVPLTIGSVGMAGYLASLHGGGIPAMALAAMPSTVLPGSVAVTVVPALPTATVALGAGSAGAGTLGAGAAAGAVGAGSAGAAGAALGAGSAAGAGAAMAGSAVAAGAAGSAAGAVGTASVAAASLGAAAGSAAAGSVGAVIATGALGAAAGTAGIAGAAAGGVMSGFGAVASLAATGFVVVGTLMAGGVSLPGLSAPLTFSGATTASVVQQTATPAADAETPSTPPAVDPAQVEPLVVDHVPVEAGAVEPVSAPAAPIVVEQQAPADSLPVDASSTPATPTTYDVQLPVEPVLPADANPVPAPESPSPADEQQTPVDDQVVAEPETAEPETAEPTDEPAAPADPDPTDPTIPADPPSTPAPEGESANDEPVTAEEPGIVLFAVVSESVNAVSVVTDPDAPAAPGSEVEPAAGDEPAP